MRISIGSSTVPGFWSFVLALGVGTQWVALVRAGDYHRDVDLRCSDCHVMHFSQTHPYDAPSGAFASPPLGSVPNPNLLRNSVNELCLSCHDGNPMATDVLGPENTGSQAAIVRLAGSLNRIGAGNASHGHTLDTLELAPGSRPTWSAQDENGAGVGLTCTNCHDAHGSVRGDHPTGSQYRNLRDDPGWAIQRDVTYNATPGVNDLTRDVFQRRVRNYDESDVDWNEPNARDSAIARWCGGCHSVIHDNDLTGSGSGAGAGGFLTEHPVFEEDLETDMVDRYNSLGNRVKVMSEIGVWYPVGRDATPTCITCHKAHGNGNPRGLIYRSGTGTLTEDGDTGGSTRQDLCRQCHVNDPLFGG